MARCCWGRCKRYNYQTNGYCPKPKPELGLSDFSICLMRMQFGFPPLDRKRTNRNRHSIGQKLDDQRTTSIGHKLIGQRTASIGQNLDDQRTATIGQKLDDQRTATIGQKKLNNIIGIWQLYNS